MTKFDQASTKRAYRLLALPLGWMLVVYLVALGVLLLTSFFSIDSFTNQVVYSFNTGNYLDVFTDSAYLNVTLRTLGVAIAVTLVCVLLAFPMALFIALLAPKKSRAVLIALAITPLWASYLVKVYAWRTMLNPETGVLNWLVGPLGISSPGYGIVAVIITLTYLWLPYMILPIYSGLERMPKSLLDAAADLGSGTWRTIVDVIIPVLKPAIFAGSIFTFSLSLGDYITVQIVGGKYQMLGNVVYQNFTLDLPFAAAVATLPVAIMSIYLWSVRKTGAMENL